MIRLRDFAGTVLAGQLCNAELSELIYVMHQHNARALPPPTPPRPLWNTLDAAARRLPRLGVATDRQAQHRGRVLKHLAAYVSDADFFGDTPESDDQWQ